MSSGVLNLYVLNVADITYFVWDMTWTKWKISVWCNQHHRADSRSAPSQWETSLQSNAVSHWLGANLESALTLCNDVSHWLGANLESAQTPYLLMGWPWNKLTLGTSKTGAVAELVLSKYAPMHVSRCISSVWQQSDWHEDIMLLYLKWITALYIICQLPWVPEWKKSSAWSEFRCGVVCSLSTFRQTLHAKWCGSRSNTSD